MTTKDQNGQRLTRNLHRHPDGTWGANVWSGHDPATNLRRYHYRTRAAARGADISDEPGRRECIRFSEYQGATP